MKRLKSVDSFRGIIMAQMIWVHIIGWWIISADAWIAGLTVPFVDRGMAGGGFLFISGLSTVLFVKSRISSGKEIKKVRKEYYLRSLFILALSLLYNTAITVGTNITWIWSWFMLQTISVSLLLSWPLLKTSKLFRIFIALLTWVLNIYLLDFLSPYEGQASGFGVIYHFLYNPLNLDPILAVYCYFLIGTVFGDIVFDVMKLEDEKLKKKNMKNMIFLPLFVIGVILLIIGVILGFPGIVYDPAVYSPTQIGWLAAVFGIDFIAFALLFFFQDYRETKTERDYRFFYYFSFYSLTVYITHNAFFFLFFRLLPWYIDYICVACVLLLYYFTLKKVYNSSWRNKISIKVAIGRLTTGTMKRLEDRKKKKE